MLNVLHKHQLTALLLATVALSFSLGAQVPSGYKVKARYLAPEEIGAKADKVVLTEVLDVVRTEFNEMIYTDVQCRTVENWHGQPEQTFFIRQPGGTLNGKTTFAGPLPDFKPGQQFVLALAETPQKWLTVFGVSQGAFHIEADSDNAVRDLSGYRLSGTVPASVQNGRETIALTELKRRITEAKAAPAASDMLRAAVDGDVVEEAPQPPPPPLPPSPSATPGDQAEEPDVVKDYRWHWRLMALVYAALAGVSAYAVYRKYKTRHKR